MNLIESLKNGFSISFASRLMRGFPSNWQSLLTVRIKVALSPFFLIPFRKKIRRKICFGGTRSRTFSHEKPISRGNRALLRFPPNPILPPFLPAFSIRAPNLRFPPSPRISIPPHTSPRESKSIPAPALFLRSRQFRSPAGMHPNCWLRRWNFPRSESRGMGLPRERHGSFTNQFIPRKIPSILRFASSPRGKRKSQIPRFSRLLRFAETWKPGKRGTREPIRRNRVCRNSRECRFTAGKINAR